FWIYLQWMPTYLTEVRHFNSTQMGIASSLPLVAATLSSMAGGWLSDRLARGWDDLRRGRGAIARTRLLIAGTAVPSRVLADNAILGIVFLTIALAGVELTVPVAWALCLDISGSFSGSVTGVMNSLGNLGGAISSVATGYIATKVGWTVPFVVSSLLCVI